MTKMFALFDEHGSPVAFYSEEIHGSRMRPIYGEAPEPTEEDPSPLPPVIGEENNPDTLVPADAIEISNEQWVDFINNPGRRRWVGGQVAEYDPPALPLTIDDYRLAIQAHVDAQAQSRRYDNGNSLASYVASTNPSWAAEAQAFVAWRDGVWEYAYAELDKVMAGDREQPSIEGIIAELPLIGWPSP